jgi:hypothetical protein
LRRLDNLTHTNDDGRSRVRNHSEKYGLVIDPTEDPLGITGGIMKCSSPPSLIKAEESRSLPHHRGIGCGSNIVPVLNSATRVSTS